MIHLEDDEAHLLAIRALSVAYGECDTIQEYLTLLIDVTLGNDELFIWENVPMLTEESFERYAVAAEKEAHRLLEMVESEVGTLLNKQGHRTAAAMVRTKDRQAVQGLLNWGDLALQTLADGDAIELEDVFAP